MPLPTVILPGYFASATEYKPLEWELNTLGIPTITVPLLARSWVPTLGGRSMVPILRQIDRAVGQLLQQHNSDRVNLVAHSAGGWIARIYLGQKHYNIHGDTETLWNARDRVATLITLGTPHLSQERWTRRNLNFVNDNYPGAFYPEVKYVCVAGKAIYGSLRQHWLAYNSYKLTCGIGNCWGDGITPIVAAHLKNAENLTLEGVMHSPRGGRLWYGSPEVREAWIRYLQ
ncbi:lipase [Oscillatoria sp. FACHB-1406]|uniref:esterase/lipase family protein n=1 Tax=Oscillatoria sp. FACHB-1406 TaxID=2692846 RepID=UPI0016850F3B|nr:lipase [Oscillatoria sp. FACHB-1406]MBD2578132.1 lipase [Oscillatoria sp. FACHB-1406]